MSNFQTEFGNGAKIIIPSIQRDYVQPLEKSIIIGFIEILVNAYADGNNKDLNYLYGINNDEGDFIPIDGQQRLTTLWLLHLYVAARLGMRIKTTIEYQTRDISGDFCTALSENFVRIDFNQQLISEEIKNSDWFIGGWFESITVKSMLIALDVIHRVIKDHKADLNNMWNNMNAGEQSPVKFAFHNPRDLGKDIYVKMNSRGKALTQFENLKAWFDDKLKTLCERYGHHSFTIKFYNDWRVSIDNEWTDLFWRNRNINSPFPEEIDDAMLRLFYTIAYIVWGRKEPKRRKQIFLKTEEKFDSEYILSQMRNSLVDIPIYELNRLDIFNEEFFIFANRAIRGIIRLETTLNECIQSNFKEDNNTKVYFWELPDKPMKFIYQLLLSEKDEKISYPKIALAASVLYFAAQDIESCELLEWMRFSRNIVNNSRIESENIHNILSAFKKWAKQLYRKGWKNFITELEYHPAIDKSQIDEEKVKFDWLYKHPDCADSLRSLENHSFFFGRISFLMNFIKREQIDTDITKTDKELFNIYANLLSNLFESDGPNRNLRKGYRFHRSVLALSDYHGYGVSSGSNWILSDSKEYWKEYIEDFDRDDYNMPHNIGFIRLLTQLKDCREHEYLKTIKNIIHSKKDNVTDWRKELIIHHELWDYMGTNNIRFGGDNKVFLLKGVALGKRNKRAELRTLGLYYYLKKEVFKTENEIHIIDERIYLNGWTLNFWDWYCSEHKNSCLYFQKNIDGRVIALDVFYDTTQNIEDAFCIEIFDRKGQQEHSREINEASLFPFRDNLNQYNFKWNSDGNFEVSNISRKETISFLCSLIPNH